MKMEPHDLVDSYDEILAAQTHPPPIQVFREMLREIKSNLPDAALIAAAPDLLTACKMALNDRMYKDWPAIADALIAAIAKAEASVTSHEAVPQDSEGEEESLLTYECGCVLGPDRGWVPCRPHQYVPVTRPTTR